MARIPAGSYAPLFRGAARDSAESPGPARRIPVAAFDLDVHPVTNAEFLAFVRAHPEWRRSRIKRLFAEDTYLSHWSGDLELGPRASAASPVVNVSWFAAKAYCAAQGKRLPTVDEWERAAAASATRADGSSDEGFLQMVSAWYARPVPDVLPAVGSTFRNAFGVWDLHGLVWEWTLDFNSALVTGESRGDAALERRLYCGSGAVGAADFRDYAAFMRFAFRGSLEARYVVPSLGFRAARDVPDERRASR
jgi:formylglycine-generating enzyme required for sulfatase activity